MNMPVTISHTANEFLNKSRSMEPYFFMLQSSQKNAKIRNYGGRNECGGEEAFGVPLFFCSDVEVLEAKTFKIFRRWDLKVFWKGFQFFDMYGWESEVILHEVFASQHFFILDDFLDLKIFQDFK